ncbi:MAG: HEAT repeat domain-containing protein, partial [Terriglobia bacterium]
DAWAELRRGKEMAEAAVAYLLSVAPDPSVVMSHLLRESTAVAEAAVHSSAGAGAGGAVELAWVEAAARDADPGRRHLAAAALALMDGQGSTLLPALLADSDREVQREAIRTAGKLKSKDQINTLLPFIAKPGVRAEALEALAAYGDNMCDRLSELLGDDAVSPAIRVQIPRALKLMPTQKCVDVLVKATGLGNLAVRSSVLKALNSLRIRAPRLDYHEKIVNERILAEAREYFELNAALVGLPDYKKTGAATRLLVRTIEGRLNFSVERLFRLLGLRYPPVEIYSAYLAYRNRRGEELSTAMEFLDNTLDKDLRRVVMPMLDEPDHAHEMGRRLFGLEKREPEAAIRDLIASGDPWLVACAIATAGELKMTGLAPDIQAAAKRAGEETGRVADQALEALACS